MKNVKRILLTITVMLFLGVGNVNAQENEPQTVIINVYEFPTMFQSRVFVTQPDGNLKTFDLKKIDYKSMEDAIQNNNALIQTEINLWKKSGFEIDGFSNSAMGNARVTTIILSQKE